MKNTLFGKDILSTRHITKDEVSLIFLRADELRKIVQVKGCTDILRGKILTALFYEPSSRTYASFISAMQRLGGGIIPLNGMTNTSVAKGETLEDTVRVFDSFGDALVMRHPVVGACAKAALCAKGPVINAGDGTDEHPTQALLDVYTMKRHFASLEGTTVTLVGDLLNGRTVHSLITLLTLYKPSHINLVSPDELRMPKEYIVYARKTGILVSETDILDTVTAKTDVLYTTRVQKERFSDVNAYERLKHRYVITRDTMKSLKKDTILMHPLPRVGEISPDVDGDPRALYLREQVPNGMYVRMAILSLILKQ